VCRIAGVVDKTSGNIEALSIAMRDTMKHGGPDDFGCYTDADAGVSVSHRRLSIIDLSMGGHQPMLGNNGDVVIAYNGEVYNYKELKAALQQEGQVFHTDSDTEVILTAYEHWGVACFSKLKGMFAIALYDKRKQILILARDPNGIKPLYYCSRNGKLFFASEIKAFYALPETWQESETWKAYILMYGYLPEPHTTLQGVYVLQKGSYMTIDIATQNSTTTVYATDSYSSSIHTEKEAIEVVRQCLNKAVDRHLIADAPIGLFLSGGIDSSLLALIAKETGRDDLHTLSIVFDDANFSEERYQQIIAHQTQSNHKSYTLSKEVFFDALPDIFRAMDQPTTDGINTYFICKYAKQYGLKAVLSGLGADELFGGYASFFRQKMVKRIKRLPAAMLGASNYHPQDKYRKLSFLSNKTPVGEYLFHRGFFSIRETAAILNANAKEIEQIAGNVNLPDAISGLPYGNRVSYMEKNMYMQSQLLRDTDMMSMWHSIEVRVPFLDVDLVNLANSIAPEVKYHKTQPKHLLVKAYNDVLPREIWDRKKQGFVFPFRKWMQGNEETSFRYADKKITTAYQAGKINWSRYWAYLMASNYSYLHRA
jgi:asparagine synthase (glutamine-hydrolysing)